MAGTASLGTYAWAPLRGLALAALALLGWPLLLVIFVGAHMGLPSPAFFVERSRWLPGLARRLAGRWGGVGIPAPYRPEPRPPSRDPDGWYRDGDDLFRSAFVPAYAARLKWVVHDPATARDLAWMVLNPLVGGGLAMAPLALIGGGLVVVLQSPAAPWWAVGGAAVVLGIVAGPRVLLWHARWTRVLLAASPGRKPSRLLAGLASALTAGARLCAVTGLAVVATALALAQVLSIVATALWLLPDAVFATRRFVSWRRDRIGAWTGVKIAEPYRAEPPLPRPEPDGTYRLGWGPFGTVHRTREAAARARRFEHAVRDPASWRDLAWLLLELPVALVLSAGPAVLITGGLVVLCWSWVWVEGLVLLGADLAWSPGDLLSAVAPALNGVPAPVSGLAAAALGLAVAPALLRCHARLSRWLLGPTRAAVLSRRVGALTASRAVIADTQAAELRRIERDLHDGAQARWVAVGMTLGAAEHLVRHDPEAAVAMIARAKDLSATALVELRELIRGIQPPILTDRGLADAVRTLAMDAPLDVETRIGLPGQVPGPIETAVYFALSELLANVAKHAAACKVTLELRHENGVLKARVTDDGQGGATATPGGGLHGIRRRLDGFDGVMTLSSPIGGPTVATLEIPCALSSPKTSTS
ncbi:MAG: sensor histidine kinase [Thermoactinospora sp.]|nr:sensor histidine kinase [Thermoactinospora sp.]